MHKVGWGGGGGVNVYGHPDSKIFIFLHLPLCIQVRFYLANLFLTFSWHIGRNKEKVRHLPPMPYSVGGYVSSTIKKKVGGGDFLGERGKQSPFGQNPKELLLIFGRPFLTEWQRQLLSWPGQLTMPLCSVSWIRLPRYVVQFPVQMARDWTFIKYAIYPTVLI